MSQTNTQTHAKHPVENLPPSVPDQLVVQGVAKKHPMRWNITPEGNNWLDWPLYRVSMAQSAIRNLIGVNNAEARVVALAQSVANDEVMSNRRKRLESVLAFVKPILRHVSLDLERLRKTKDKTPRLERYGVGRTELAMDAKFSLGMSGDLIHVLFWAFLFAVGALAEVVVGKFNITRAAMEGMTGGMAWIMAFLPFLGTYAALKWLDPGDVDRDRHRFYKWLTRGALLITPIGMFLFSAKLDALTETDWSDPNASMGPSYTWVIWMMQISFAIAIYLSSIKLGEAWFHFLGYDVRKTREYVDLCDDIATSEDAWRSLVEIYGRIEGAIAAIDARMIGAIEEYKSELAKCIEDAANQRRLADAKANAAAANARLEAETSLSSEETESAVAA